MNEVIVSMQARHAQVIAEAAERDVEAKFWCGTCESHVVRRPGADCPCCEGNGT